MIKITFPDGGVREYESGVSGLNIAKSIAKSLAKKALAVKLDGVVVDLNMAIENDAAIEIITHGMPEALELIRHDAAHIMAEAVQKLFPGTQVTIGPSIENGFYYDFAREEAFSTDDLEKIEKEMHEIVKRNEAFIREEWDRDEAISHFKAIGEDYKAELISDLPEDETISIYRQGEWYDLCRGPHLPSTGKVGHAFKLMKLAGAYWRGDSNNAMLQRIYGTAWENEKQLKAYLQRLEEAEKRDHRKLGKALNLFHFQEEAIGQVFWHDKGWTIYTAIKHYIRAKLREYDYKEVNTPQIISSELYKKSGHWDKFGTENMFVIPDEGKDREYAMKPMNCPCHVQIFNQGIKSYRDLPLRMSEFGICARNEAHGALHGLMRVASMVQDDAHIFCTTEQIESEVVILCNMIKEIYADFDFEEPYVKFSDRPEMRVGSDEVWDQAEEALKKACETAGLKWVLNEGEGAFYGPKLEFVLKDAIGRDWQCGTVQLDFNLPNRLGAEYTDVDGSRKNAVMIHRALLGSMERFIGILIEHYAGKFPLWLSPVQAVVTPIVSDVDDYAKEVYQKLHDAGLRVSLDLRNEKINYKVREHSVQKTPAIIVVGHREVEEKSVAVRRLGTKYNKTMGLDEAIESLVEEAKNPLER